MRQPSPAFWAQAAQRYEEIRRGERREPRATELIADVHGGRLTRSDLIHRVGFVERIRERRTAGFQHRRESRPTPTRRRGSRRAGASSRTSSADPPDDDPDPEPESPRSCGGCGEPLVGKAPQARYHNNACRMREARRREARDRAQAIPDDEIAPFARMRAIPEAEIAALALRDEQLAALAELMEEIPRGAAAGSLARQERSLARASAGVIV